MIEERFLKRAIEIRKTYLKLSKNMNLYEARAKQVLSVLQETLSKIETLQSNIKDKKVNNVDDANQKLLEILNSVEKEGSRLEKLVDPLNKEIEKLKEEEAELYRLIKQTHINLTEDQIIKEIHNKIVKENLS